MAFQLALDSFGAERWGSLAAATAPVQPPAASEVVSEISSDFDEITHEKSDEFLLARIQRHDETALSALYDRYRAPVYSLAAHVTHNAALADEVTQDTFMKVWTRAAQYQVMPGRLRNWLLVITRRTAIDVLRREYRASGRYAAFEHDDLPLRYEGVVDGRAEEEAAWRDLCFSMAHLPSEQRQVIELSFYQGFSQREIADYLGIPLGTIKTRARLGLEKLREIFGDDSRLLTAESCSCL